MNLPRNYGTYNKRRIIMPKSGEETGLKSPKTAASWPKISNTRRKHNKDENLENYDSEVQMHARAHSGPWLANYNHLRLSARNCARTKLRGEFRNILHANFFMFILLISNHTVFLVQFGSNLHLWVFQKAEIALAEAARAISTFWKTHSCKLIPNWTRNRMITYTNWTHKFRVAL